MGRSRWAAGIELGRVGVGVPVDASLPRAVLRYTIFGAALVTALLFYVWSRTDTATTLMQLDVSRSTVAALQAEQQRLELELSHRRGLERLATVAGHMELGSP